MLAKEVAWQKSFKKAIKLCLALSKINTDKTVINLLKLLNQSTNSRYADYSINGARCA